MHSSTKIRNGFLGLVSLLITVIISAQVSLAAIKPISVSMEYKQTNARAMLKTINEFRTGDDAWCWDEYDKVKVMRPGLKEYIYDYNLEAIAMQRCAEIVFQFAHQRPDGSDCFSCTYNNVSSWGENICYNSSSGMDAINGAFTQFEEADRSYAGQGHRRNMLNQNFKTIGLAAIEYGGLTFVVQEFGYSLSTNGSVATPAVDTFKDVYVNVDTNILKPELSFYDNWLDEAYSDYYPLIKLEYGSECDLPDVFIKYGEYRGKFTMDNLTWTTSDPNIAQIVDNKIVAMNVGETVIKASCIDNGKQITVSDRIVVTTKSLTSDSIKITYNNSLTYNGKNQIPDIKITNGNKTLIKDVDYKFSSDNVISKQAGSYRYYLQGLGNYTGYTDIEYRISPLDISKVDITCEKEVVYKGVTSIPTYSVKLNGTNISATDYTVTTSNSIDVGDKATITFKGFNNLTGSKTFNYSILPCEITDKNTTVVSPESYVYTGSPIEITTYVAHETSENLLEPGVDYKVSYKNNLNAGTATATLNFTGNYKGKITRTFEIEPMPIAVSGVKVLVDSQLYTGSALKPAIKVQYFGSDFDSANYKVEYSNNVNPGTGKVTVTFTGNYSGKYSTQFLITTPAPTATPKPTTDSKPVVTSVPADSSDGGAGGFIERIYTIALDRPSDKAGKEYWIGELQNGATGAFIAEQFLYSQEFLGMNRNDSEFLQVLYKTFFNREGDSDGIGYWLSQMNGGMTKQEVIQGFYNSPEWADICLTYGIKSGSASQPTITISPNDNVKAFTSRMYTTCLYREAETAGLEYWATELANLRMTGTEVARLFFYSDEFKSFNLGDAEYLLRLYKTFLGREPEADGFSYWLTCIQNGSMSRDDVFDGFSVSPEYAQICADYGILK